VLQQLLDALHNRGGTALQRLDSTHRTAKKAHHAFSQTLGLPRLFLQLLRVGFIDLVSCIAQPFLWIAQLFSWAFRKLAQLGDAANEVNETHSKQLEKQARQPQRLTERVMSFLGCSVRAV
jgi:hypothetical protein